MSGDLKNIVEAVLMVSDTPVTVARIQGLFNKGSEPTAGDVRQAIADLQQDCEGRGVELSRVGSGYRYQTREKYADWVRTLQAVKPPRMSRALLETLAIIAYRQPVTRSDIEEIRGVSVTTEIMQRLLEREWVKEVGVRDVPGRPTLFGTTSEFLSYFNLASLKDLPALMDERALGDIAGELETPLPAELLASLQGVAEAGKQEEQPPAQQDVFAEGEQGADSTDAALQQAGEDNEDSDERDAVATAETAVTADTDEVADEQDEHHDAEAIKPVIDAVMDSQQAEPLEKAATEA